MRLIQYSIILFVFTLLAQAAPVLFADDFMRQPGQTGDWHIVSGDYESDPVSLSLPVFSPALGRNDTHAVSLYRFTEAVGNVVHDTSPLGNPADLTFPVKDPVAWVPGGLQLGGYSLLQSAGPVSKLGAIKKANAATIEIWSDNFTKYPPTDKNTLSDDEYFIANLFSWGDPRIASRGGNSDVNFAIGNQWEMFIFSPRGYRLHADTGGLTRAREYCLRLQHTVITWDGTTTSFYRNGELVISGNMPYWQIKTWANALPIYVGNSADRQHPYLGVLHLLAVHDREMPAIEVRNNYQAGPGAAG